MPPLFVYAIAFLVVLTIVTFVLCHRADAGEKAPAVPAGPSAAPERSSSQPLRRIDAPSLASAPAGREADAGRDHASAPVSRRAGTSGDHASPLVPASRGAGTGGDRASPLVPAGREAGNGGAVAPGRDSAEAAAIDLLGLQVAELTRQVAELQAERQAVRDEIRGLSATVAGMSAPAPVRPLRPVRLVEAEPRRQRIGG